MVQLQSILTHTNAYGVEGVSKSIKPGRECGGTRMHDWTKGTPARIKDVPLKSIELKFAEIVDALVTGEGTTQAQITRLQISPNADGKVEMTILFERQLDTEAFFGKGKEEKPA